MTEKAPQLVGKKRGRVEMREGDEVVSVVAVDGVVLAITRQGYIREIIALQEPSAEPEFTPTDLGERIRSPDEAFIAQHMKDLRDATSIAGEPVDGDGGTML